MKESRGSDLRQKLARLELQQQRDQGDFYPTPKLGIADGQADAPLSVPPRAYVAFPRAMHQLSGRLDATPEELAAWVFMGPANGGLAAYLNANELDPPPRFHYTLGDRSGDDHDYVLPLTACWFREDEIAGFHPEHRFITGRALIERWSGQQNLNPAAFIRAKITESRLLDMHPIYGMTRGSTPDDASSPPLTAALFPLSQVEAIESEDFPIDWEAGLHGAGVLIHASPHLIGAQPMFACNAGEQPPESPRAAASKLDPPAETAAVPREPGPLAYPCDVFLSMPSLLADELTIAFIGDRSDTGLGANNMLEISARNTTRRVALAGLDLVDRRKGGPNNQALILLGMARGLRLTHTPQNATKIKRLRDVLRSNFGLVGDPFQPYRQNDGWVPRFTVVDKRGAADERAKREAERRTVSLDEVAEHRAHLQQTPGSHRFFEAEGDDADAWLRANDQGDSA